MTERDHVDKYCPVHGTMHSAEVLERDNDGFPSKTRWIGVDHRGEESELARLEGKLFDHAAVGFAGAVALGDLDLAEEALEAALQSADPSGEDAA